MEIGKEYKFVFGENSFSFKKTSSNYTSRIDICPFTDHYSAYKVFDCFFQMYYKIQINMGLSLNKEQMDKLEKLEEDDFLSNLSDLCKKASMAFWYSVPEEKSSSKRICNLCRYFNLLSLVCNKHGGWRKKDDTCKDFAE